MEPSSPVPSSQEPATGRFGGSDESIPHVEDFWRCKNAPSGLPMSALQGGM